VFNRPSGPKLLAAIAKLDIDQVRRALATAEGQGLIRVVDAEDGRPRVVFRHPNIREALLDELRDDGGLPQWHETCAAVLEERAQGNIPPVAETLATHLERANNAARAVGFYAIAIQHALSQFAFDDAIDLGRRGARVAQAKGVSLDDVMRVDLAQGKALLHGGRTREARAFLESAIERKDAGRGSSYAALHLWLARACQKLGDIAPGMAAVERALGVVGNDPVATGRLLLARGELQLAAWPGKAGRDADKALQLLGKRPTLDDELAALAVRAHASMGQGRYAEAASSAWRRVELCQRNDLRLDEISALRDFAVATALSGDRLGARTHLNNALKLARQANHRVEEALLQQALGDQLFISGAYSEAIGRYQNAATLAAETGQSLARAECLKSIGRSYQQKGDYDRAVDHLRAAVDDFDRAASDDDVVRARSDLVQALLTKNATAEAEGVLDGARKRLRAAVPRVMSEFALAEGMTAMQRGDDTEARASMVKAVVAARQTGDRYALGEALVALAQLLLRTQQPRRAWRMSRRAEWIFTDLDARGQLKRMAPLLNASAGLAQVR
jgi:tetratricopeptide (TPR) repeat protein